MKRIFSALFVICCSLLCCTVAQVPAQPPTIEEWRATTLREIEQLKQVVSQEPNLVSYFKLGTLYNRLGQWSDAVGAFEKAVALTPAHAESHYELGWAYSRWGKHEMALAEHQRAAELQPQSGAAWFALGWDHCALQHYGDAVALYQRALTAETRFAPAAYELGRAYLALGKSEDATAQLEALSQTDTALAALLKQEIARTGMAAPPKPVAPSTEKKGDSLLTATGSLKPTISYKEKARYTSAARDFGVAGTVLLSAVFTADGQVTGIRVIRGLPLGLSEEAVSAAAKIRFTPATKEGQAVSVRMQMEFYFQLL